MTYAERIQALIIAYANGEESKIKITGDAYTIEELGNFMPNGILIYINSRRVYQKFVLSQVNFNPTLAVNAVAALQQREDFLKVVYEELIALGY